MTRTTLGPVRSWRQRRTVRSETHRGSARSSSVRIRSSADRAVVGIWFPRDRPWPSTRAYDAGQGALRLPGSAPPPGALRHRQRSAVEGDAGLPERLLDQALALLQLLGAFPGPAEVFLEPGLQLGDPVASCRLPAARAAAAAQARFGLWAVGVAADALEHLLGLDAVQAHKRDEGVVPRVREDPRAVGVAAEAAVLERHEALCTDVRLAGDVRLGVAEVNARLREPRPEVVPAGRLLAGRLLLPAHQPPSRVDY